MPVMRKLFVDAKFLVNNLEYEVEVVQEILGLPDFEPVVLLPDEEMEVEDQHTAPTNNQEAPGNNETATQVIDHANDDESSMNNQDNESSSVETANSENAPGLSTGNISRPSVEQTDVRIGLTFAFLDAIKRSICLVLRAGPRSTILFSSRKGPELPEYRKELTGMADTEFYNFMLAWFEVMMRCGIVDQSPDENMSMLDVEDFSDIFDHFFGEAFEEIEQEEQLINQEQQQNNQ